MEEPRGTSVGTVLGHGPGAGGSGELRGVRAELRAELGAGWVPPAAPGAGATPAWPLPLLHGGNRHLAPEEDARGCTEPTPALLDTGSLKASGLFSVRSCTSLVLLEGPRKLPVPVPGSGTGTSP